MWIEKTKDGKYKFREQYKNPLTGKYNKVSVTKEKKTNIVKRQAQIELEQKIQDRLQYIQDGTIKRGVTLGQVIEEWEPIYKKQVLSSTFFDWQSYKRNIKKYVGFDLLVSKMTTKFLVNLFEDLLYKQDVSKNVVYRIKSNLFAILKYAYKQSYVSTPPASSLPINWPKDRSTPNVEEKYLDDDELKAVLHYAYQHRPTYGALLEWQSLTGMRFGEAASMQVKNIYQEDGKYYADVTGTMVYHGLRTKDFYKSDLTKTKAGHRTVFLPRRAVAIYQEYAKGKTSDDFLFLQLGHLIDLHSVDNLLRNAKRELHINKTLTTHTMRHTHVSKLAELGVPLYIIQKRVGHSDPKITEEVYMHVTKKAKIKYDNLIDLI